MIFHREPKIPPYTRNVYLKVWGSLKGSMRVSIRVSIREIRGARPKTIGAFNLMI